VIVTENAIVYYQQARVIAGGLQQANEQVNQQQVHLSGTLRVRAAGGFALYFVAPALLKFLSRHPDLTVDLDLNSRLVNLLEDSIDFAIRYGELNDSNLIARKLVSRRMMEVASERNLQQYNTPKHSVNLKHHSCIVSFNDSWEFNVDGNKEIVKVKGRLRSNNANVVLDTCKKGLGVAYMLKSLFKEAVESEQLVPILEPFLGQGTSCK
jgi:DNA-binding transcriptional LysR family regulator